MTRRRALWLAAAVLLVALQLVLQANAARAARRADVLGVTLSDPVTAQQFAAARAWEQSADNTAGITASFWNEKTGDVTADSGLAAKDAVCIGFAGNAQDCLPADYQQGTAPGAVGQQCAVSSALAWALFGSSDIVGQCVTLDRVPYFISGVFDGGDEKILLYPAKSGFTRAALRGVSPDTPKAAAEQWAAAAGVGALQAIDYAPQRAWLARALCNLPAALVGVCLLAAVLRLLSGLPRVPRGVAYFALALAFAWAVPQLLQTLPGWLVPNRWSNFAFWSNLVKEIRQNTAHYY